MTFDPAGDPEAPAAVSSEDVRRIIVETLEERWADAGESGPRPSELSDDVNFFDLKFFDSFALVDLILAVETRAGIEIDLWDLEPERIFTLRGLAELVDTEIRRVKGA